MTVGYWQIAKLESRHWGLVIGNQRVTWPAFAILSMFHGIDVCFFILESFKQGVWHVCFIIILVHENDMFLQMFFWICLMSTEFTFKRKTSFKCFLRLPFSVKLRSQWSHWNHALPSCFCRLLFVKVSRLFDWNFHSLHLNHNLEVKWPNAFWCLRRTLFEMVV